MGSSRTSISKRLAKTPKPLSIPRETSMMRKNTRIIHSISSKTSSRPRSFHGQRDSNAIPFSLHCYTLLPKTMFAISQLRTSTMATTGIYSASPLLWLLPVQIIALRLSPKIEVLETRALSYCKQFVSSHPEVEWVYALKLVGEDGLEELEAASVVMKMAVRLCILCRQD